MTTGNNTDDAIGDLEQLFDLAAAKSLAVINPSYAEPEMIRFLQEVQNRPEMRECVVKMFRHSFSIDYYMSTPWQFFSFCMHKLKWPELRDFIAIKRNDDLQRRCAASSPLWNDILAAFEDDWKDAQQYKSFSGAIE